MNESQLLVAVRRATGSWVAFGVSMCIHLLAVLALSFILIGGQGSGVQGIRLTGTDASDDSLELLEAFEISSDSAKVQESSPPELPDAALAEIEVPVESVVQMATLDSNQAISSAVAADVGQAVLAGGSGFEVASGDGQSKQPGNQGTGATFFGTQASGYRFVFVIDSSMSMIGPRWEALRSELNRAIRSLSPDQEFFVISFDSVAHPMFNKLPPKGTFLAATTENVSKLNNWVNAIQHGGNTFPASAIGIALQLEPDAIFLLSDGEIRDSTLYDLRRFNRRPDEEEKVKVGVPIHTVLLHSDAGFMTLKTIADENDGVFTPVSLHPMQQ